MQLNKNFRQFLIFLGPANGEIETRYFSFENLKGKVMARLPKESEEEEIVQPEEEYEEEKEEEKKLRIQNEKRRKQEEMKARLGAAVASKLIQKNLKKAATALLPLPEEKPIEREIRPEVAAPAVEELLIDPTAATDPTELARLEKKRREQADLIARAKVAAASKTAASLKASKSNAQDVFMEKILKDEELASFANRLRALGKKEDEIENYLREYITNQLVPAIDRPTAKQDFNLVNKLLNQKLDYIRNPNDDKLINGDRSNMINYDITGNASLMEKDTMLDLFQNSKETMAALKKKRVYIKTPKRLEAISKMRGAREKKVAEKNVEKLRKYMEVLHPKEYDNMGNNRIDQNVITQSPNEALKRTEHPKPDHNLSSLARAQQLMTLGLRFMM
jgi:hypothetical protein